MIITAIKSFEIFKITNVFAGGDTIQPIESDFSFFTLLQTLYGIIFPLAVVFGFFKVVYAGYMLMTSQGDPQRVQAGQEELTSAIMGMIFILGAVGILRVIIGSIITGGDPGF